MKKLKKSKLKMLVVLALLLVVSLSTVVFAANEEDQVEANENDIALISTNDESAPVDTSEGDSTNEVDTSIVNQILKSDQYLFEDKVEINNPVSGNLYIIANEVTINNQVDGNAFIIARKVNFTNASYIYSDVFVMAGDVTVDGYMYDLYCMGNNVTISNEACVIRDLHLSCENFTFGGLVRRDAFINANTITTDDANALINGKLEYTAPENNFPSTIVSGEIKYSEPETEVTKNVKDIVKDIILNLVLALIIILIVVLALPKFAEKEEKLLKNRIGSTIGFGALALIAIPVIAIVGCMTVIGILPAIALFVLYIFVLQVAESIVAVPISNMICKKINKNTKLLKVVFAMLYVLVCALLNFVPVVNMIIGLANAILAMGLIVCSIFAKNVEKK